MTKILLALVTLGLLVAPAYAERPGKLTMAVEMDVPTGKALLLAPQDIVIIGAQHRQVCPTASTCAPRIMMYVRGLAYRVGAVGQPRQDNPVMTEGWVDYPAVTY